MSQRRRVPAPRLQGLRRAKDDLEIRVAARTAQLREANESLEAELRVRRDMEKSLRFSEAKYRTLVEQIPAITYTISLAAGVDFLYVSPQVEALLGFSPEACRSHAENWERQIHPDDREMAEEQLAGVCQGKEATTSFTYRLTRADKTTFWGEVTATAVHDEFGTVRGVLLTTRDVTERKKLELRLYAASDTGWFPTQLLDLKFVGSVARSPKKKSVYL